MSRVLQILESLSLKGRERTCEACGSEFTCGASLKGCWCSEIQLSDESRAYLKSRYSDCLCRTCLESEEQRAKRQEQSAKSKLQSS